MKKATIITILALVVLAVILISSKTAQKELSTETPVVTETQENVSSYNGELSFTVQKVFLEKPTEAVTGTISDLGGDLQYSNGVLEGTINASTLALTTGADHRDGEVKKLLGSNLTATISEVAFALNTTQTVPVTLTVNDMSKDIPFEIIGQSNPDGSIHLMGTSKILMSELGVTAPSMAGIYSVEDDVMIQVHLNLPQQA